MNQHLSKSITEISCVSQEILSQSPCRAFAALRMCDEGRSVKISGNSEGLIYLASILTGLASDANSGQHFHFEEGQMLDEADHDLIFQFEAAEWDSSSSN